MVLYNFCSDEPILPQCKTDFWIASSADIIGRVVLNEGVSVWYGTVIRGDNEWIHIGNNSNIQDNAVLHSDEGFPLSIGVSCTIGHRTILHGCTIGNNCLIGMGAIILNGACIGKDSLVGAGSLVTQGKKFPEKSLIMGSPARLVRSLEAQEIEEIRQSSQRYVQNWKKHVNNKKI